jgi:hypothetical protein
MTQVIGRGKQVRGMLAAGGTAHIRIGRTDACESGVVYISWLCRQSHRRVKLNRQERCQNYDKSGWPVLHSSALKEC